MKEKVEQEKEKVEEETRWWQYIYLHTWIRNGMTIGKKVIGWLRMENSVKDTKAVAGSR